MPRRGSGSYITHIKIDQNLSICLVFYAKDVFKQEFPVIGVAEEIADLPMHRISEIAGNVIGPKLSIKTHTII